MSLSQVEDRWLCEAILLQFSAYEKILGCPLYCFDSGVKWKDSPRLGNSMAKHQASPVSTGKFFLENLPENHDRF